MFGAKFIGDDGTVQIDEEFVCWTFKSKATVYPTIDHFYGSRLYDIVVTSAEMPMIAISVPGTSDFKGASVFKIDKVGTTWTFKVLSFHNTATDFSFTYYVFDRPTTVTSSGFGLLIRDASGKATFNAEQPVMSIVGVGSGLTVPSGKTYAVVSTAQMQYSESIVWDTNTLQDFYYYVYTMNFWKTNGVVTTFDVDLDGGATPGQGPNWGYENYGNDSTNPLIIDVTNL